MTELPSVPGGFATVLADPPWGFRSWGDKGKNRAPDALVRQQRLGERHYATMSLDAIKALPVGDVAARDAVLVLWVIDCMIPQALAVGTAWGFAYKTTAVVWRKRRASGAEYIGLGYWGRGGTEQAFLFTRGQPRRLSAGVRKLIDAPVREHSRKPDEQYERIEALCAGPRLELFARHRRQGWTSWGDQLTLPPVLDRIIALRKQGKTQNEIARAVSLKTTAVSDAIKYAEAMGRLTGREFQYISGGSAK